MALPSFTQKTWTCTYPAIDPLRPELSAKGKTVVITGAGSGGIGHEVALAFTRAGARSIAIIGRTQKTLQQTRDAIVDLAPETTVLVVVADISKDDEANQAAAEIRAGVGCWDIFANFAAVLPRPNTIANSDKDDWWKPFEVSTRFAFIFARYFVPGARDVATFINCNSAVAHVHGSIMPLNSAYSASKIAAAKLDEYIALDHTWLRVFTFHPGVVDTGMFKRMTADISPEDSQPQPNLELTEPSLPANFTVWLTSSEAEFLRGRYVWARWDVEEMMARKEEISADPVLLTVTIGGWPFTST